MKALKNTLFLFTHEYPYGTGEPFIENELRLLSENFQTVYLFPLKKNGVARILPAENIQVHFLFEKTDINKWKLLITNFLFIARVLIFEFKYLSSFQVCFKLFSKLRSILLINLHRAQILEKSILNSGEKNIVFYSFWTDDWATILSILKKKNTIDKFFTRGHGYDVYEERWAYGVIPFRNFQLENVFKFFTVSKNGLDYLTARYPKYQSKFELSYLTIPDSGENPFSTDGSTFTLVSCSSLIPLKRVELIVEILMYIKFEMTWIHFGDGPAMEELQKMAIQLPSTISVKFAGAVSNNQLIDYYKSNSIHLFISTSSTEGLPISIQEAVSFGIPAIATNVGGVAEIVNENTGVLIEKEFDPEKVAELIAIFREGRMNTIEFRKSVRKYWIENFSALKNHENFRNLLLS